MILSFRKEDPVDDVPSISLEPHSDWILHDDRGKTGPNMSRRSYYLNLPPVTAAHDSSSARKFESIASSCIPEYDFGSPRDPFRWIMQEAGAELVHDGDDSHGMSPTLRNALKICQATSGETEES